MKKLFLGCTAMIGGSAIAADLPPVYPVPPPPPAVIYDPWTGFYIGINAGYGSGIWNSSSLTSIFPSASGFATTDRPTIAGWQAGGQIGFNLLIDGSWLFGVEADAQVAGQRADSRGFAGASTPTPDNNFNIVTTQSSINQWQLPWFASLRGRIGGLADSRTLVYATGGLAAGEFKFFSQTSFTAQLFGPGPTGAIPAGPLVSFVGPSFSQSAMRFGAAAGIGVEYKFTPNLSGKLEYLYLDFGSYTFLTGTGVDTNVRLRENLLRFGVNYTFGPP
jgi:outer membrane immunogenic protein